MIFHAEDAHMEDDYRGHAHAVAEQDSTSSPKSAESEDKIPVPERKSTRPRGFAAMDPELRREIARKGGQAAHRAGTAHEFTTEEAREAGRKGSRATHAKRRALQEASEQKNDQ